MPANAYRDAFVLPEPASAVATPLYFVKLEARASDGALLADNFYWLSPRLFDCEQVYTGDLTKAPANRPMEVPRQTPCLAELAALPSARLDAQAAPAPGLSRPGEACLRVDLSNPGDTLAFFLRLRLRREDGEEVLPVFWEDNYLELMPGESRVVHVSWPHRDQVRPHGVEAAGWNTAVAGAVAGAK
jgi:exo-1,4-beta-D-glucosaminidase